MALAPGTPLPMESVEHELAATPMASRKKRRKDEHASSGASEEPRRGGEMLPRCLAPGAWRGFKML